MANSRTTLFWRQYRRRQSGGGAGAVVYAVYVGALVVLIYGAPLIRGLAGNFHKPAVLDVLLEPGTGEAISAALGLVLAGAFAIGTTRGPAVTRPFVAHALATSDLPRRRAFIGATVRSIAAVVLASVAIAAILAGPIADGGAMTWTQLAVTLAASALFGLVVGSTWLAGQAARGAAVWAAPLALIAAAAVGLALPGLKVTPWAWAGATWPDGSASAPTRELVLLGVVAVALSAATPWVLDSLRGPGLVEQSRRWEGATVAATTGDISTALGEFRAPPTVGRRWRLVSGHSFAWAVLRADLAATARTPLRAVVSVLSLGLGAYAYAVASDVPGLLGWALLLGAGLMVYTGLGPLSDGLRHAVLAVTTPRLFGVGDGALVRAHAWAPVVGGVVVAGLGVSAAVVVAGVSVGGSGWFSVFALVLALVVVRLATAAKGTPPLWLSAPVMTPMGDLSVIGQLAWQLDAVLFAAVVSGALSGAVAGSTAGGWILVATLSLVWLLFRLRLKKL